MEFDVSRVYTAVNADELKIGSKIYVSDDIDTLKSYVKSEMYIWTLTKVLPESNSHRFVVNNGADFFLAYLVEPPEEKKLKVSDLKVGDIVRHKSGKLEYLVEGIDHDNNSVFFGADWSDDEDLGKYWEKVEND